MKQRLLSLDAIRGFAILLVILGHVIGRAVNWDPLYLSYPFEFLKAVHMPLFIIIAGYFIQKQINSILQLGGGAER